MFERLSEAEFGASMSATGKGNRLVRQADALID